jgi:hypothetical protein
VELPHRRPRHHHIHRRTRLGKRVSVARRWYYSLADRGYFQDAMRTGDFAIGKFVTGRITQKPTLQFAQAIPGTGSRPEGVVLANIDLDYLAAHQARAGLPPEATLTVADREGTILLHLPNQAE